MNIPWEQTVIVSDEQHEDFTAKNGEPIIDRVYRHHSGVWFWTMNAWGPDIVRPKFPASGTVADQQEAADTVRRVYEACLRRWRATRPL